MGGDRVGYHSLQDPLAPVTSFKYIGRVLSVEDEDWPEVVNNLHR